MQPTTSGSDLTTAAAVSDQIRNLSRQAFLMRMHATNATIVTRSSGVRVPGFEAVSTQMGELSKELAACLVRLRAATVSWLRVISTRVASDREIAALDLTRKANEATARAVTPVLARLTAHAEADLSMRGAHRLLVGTLDEARRLASTACVLARAAKLEAVYGGTVADALTEAASSFTELADSVDEAVRTIARRLDDRSWKAK